VRNLANGNVGAAISSAPAISFPLIAREGGVLMRSGHTEAAVDLCKLASLPPIGVICELVNDDGTVMRGPQVQAFAERNNLKQVSVADLIAYRQRKETLIERVGSFRHRDAAGQARAYLHAALGPDAAPRRVFGDIRDGEDVPVRLHIGERRRGRVRRRRPIDRVMKRWPRQSAASSSICAKARSASARSRKPQAATDAEAHAEAKQPRGEWREIGLGAQILKDLGITSINLLSSRERHYVGLEGFGIKIAGTEIL
jgi:3,4-dihydroxy 2-butanone 4-phosphate synthase/GTP cyclohydrolase II